MMTVFGPTVEALTNTLPFIIPPTPHPSPLPPFHLYSYPTADFRGEGAGAGAGAGGLISGIGILIISSTAPLTVDPEPR
jgi:hypothetical protein